MRAVFFDEVVFEQQGVLLGCYHDIFDVGDFPYQHLNLSADRIDLDEVGADPFLQVLCFPDIDDAVLIIKILVNAWLIRQGPDNGLEM